MSVNLKMCRHQCWLYTNAILADWLCSRAVVACLNDMKRNTAAVAAYTTHYIKSLCILSCLIPAGVLFFLFFCVVALFSP